MAMSTFADERYLYAESATEELLWVREASASPIILVP